MSRFVLIGINMIEMELCGRNNLILEKPLHNEIRPRQAAVVAALVAVGCTHVASGLKNLT